MCRLLLIDDDVELAALLREYLVQEGFDVDVAQDGHEGAQAAYSGRYALVVLDAMLPRLAGEEVLRRIRRRGDLPVLMLTARGDDADRITGPELGADDYVAKPCTPRELAARVRSILRRLRPHDDALRAQPVLRAGRLVMWPERRRADGALRKFSTADCPPVNRGH